MWRLLIPLLFPFALAAEEVDIELVLAVDVSRSMSPAELDIQRRGYAAALRSPAVLAAVEGGMLGKVAITYVEWAGAGNVAVIVPWTLIGTRGDADGFAARIEAHRGESQRRTSISGALEFGARLIEENGFEGLRRVIDVSGDGPNNEGARVTAARDRVLAEGIVVNGLPLMTAPGMGARWYHLDDLDAYYVACVIGGPGSFMIPVRDWAEFADAVRRKLVLEIAGAAPRVIPAANIGALPGGGYDCEIGEKLWEQMQRLWFTP